jgi:hypothetical protein
MKVCRRPQNKEMKMRRCWFFCAVLLVTSASASLANPSDWTDSVNLDAQRVVPPTDSHGTGLLEIFLMRPEGGDGSTYTACYHDLDDSVTTVTICHADSGANGPVLHTLFTGGFVCGSAAPATGWSWDEIGWAEAGQLYVLISTLAHPEGELRGQLHLRANPIRYISWGSVKTAYR